MDEIQKKTYGQSCLIKVSVGDQIRRKRDGIVGTLVKFYLAPNGNVRTESTELIAVLHVKKDDGTLCISTSEKWEPIEHNEYEIQYYSCD